MKNPIKGAARQPLGALSSREVQSLVESGVLITDDRRHRPHYFDGRFLTARDLTREQDYFLTRLSDLGRAQGFGVVEGLDVAVGPGASLELEPGYGYTPAGELVMLSQDLTLPVADLARSQRLDAAFGLRAVPNQPARSLTGLFVVVLRPVEFTANPITSYPTAVSGPRGTEDGDVIEATAVSLVPYQPQAAVLEPRLARAQVAREVFIDGVSRALPENALPLAMIALERGVPLWVDVHMVRRDIGAERHDVLGLGLAPRALREAHARHYDAHLEEVLAERDAAGRGRRFEASEHFSVLPPAGRIPAAAVDATDFTQVFFPPEVDVELSIVPEDEVPLLLEESLLLPPIDLALPGEEQESTSVLLLVPVPRSRLRTLMHRLESRDRLLSGPADRLSAQRKPIEALTQLRLPRLPARAPQAESVGDAAWREVLAGTEYLWYARRRNLSYRAEIEGLSIPVRRDDGDDEGRLVERLQEQDLGDRFTRLAGETTASSRAEIVGVLASPELNRSRITLEGALVELETRLEADEGRLTRTRVTPVLERFAAPGTGEGIARLEATQPELTNSDVARTIALSRQVPELDALARRLNEERAAALSSELHSAARTDAGKVGDVITRWLEENPR